jgi:hypothetical protein
MTADEIQSNVEKRLPGLIKQAYAAIDNELADLMDKAERMPPAVFYREVQAAIDRVPSLYPLLDSRPIQDELETSIGEAIIGGLQAK